MAPTRHTRAAGAAGNDASGSAESTIYRKNSIIKRDFASSKPLKKTRTAGSPSSSDAADGGASPGEDEESGGGQDDQDDNDGDDDEDAEGIAPSGGLGKGHGKHPATGLTGRKPAYGLRAGLSVSSSLNKKRTFSNVSTNSVLRNDVEDNSTHYPRRKSAKRFDIVADDEPAIESGNIFGPDAPALVENAIETDDDDEDDYGGVDLISHSDDDGPDMEMLEEKAIIESEEDANLPRRGSVTSSETGSDYQLGTEGLFPADNFFEEQFHRGQPAVSLDIQAEDVKKSRKHSEGSHRRVHFDDDVRSSDSASTHSTEHDFSLYPDLTLLESGIGPLDSANAHHSELIWYAVEHSENSDSSSYWDLHEEQAPAHPETDSEMGLAETSSSGYESDTGDTTDEDLPPETTVHTPSALLHRRPSSSTDGSGRSRASSRRSTKPRARHTPKMASWKVDPKKTIAIIDASGKRMLLFPAREPPIGHLWTESTASTISNQSPQTPFQPLTNEDSDPSDFSGQPIGSPDIMLNGGFGNLFGNEIIGPPEAFFPFTNFDADGQEVPSEDDLDLDDLTDNENMISINDIIDCGDDTDDELEVSQDQETTDIGETTDVPATPAASAMAPFGSTPGSITPRAHSAGRRSMDAHEMLSHFDRGIVNSFRANQNRCRNFRRPQEHAMRSSMARPLRNGRASDTLITPVRKRRTHASVDMKGSPLAKKGPMSGTFGPPLRRPQRTGGT